MRVRLNLATKLLESHRRFLAGASLSAFVGAVAFLALGWHVYSVRKAATEVRARSEKMRQEFAVYGAQRSELERYFAQKNVANLHDRAAFINDIIAVRSFNWTQMFMDLERILPGGVRVISIEPKQVSGHVELKLTVGTISDEAELKFERALEDSKEFTEVRIESVHSPASAGNQSGDQKVVQLTTVYSRS